MNKVFLIGGNHHNMLGVIRSLGERGIKPYVIIQSEERHPYISFSKYIDVCWRVNDENEAISLLTNEANKFNGEKVTLIACADNLASLIDIHHDKLKQWYNLPGTEECGRVSHLMDKEVMSNLARKIGFLVPCSAPVDTSTNKNIDIPLPWIIKPLISKNGLKADIERIYSIEGWNNYILKHRLMVQVQQLIDKDFEYQLIGLSLNNGEEVIIPGYSYVIRPASNTNTGFLQYKPLDESYKEIVEKGKLFLKATGYSGLFSLEFLRGKDGKDYFMEINFRNDGNAICVTAAGFNLPYIWYLYNTGGNYREEIEASNVKPTYVMPEFADISLITHGQLGFFKWLKDIHRTDRFMEFDKHDMKPFFYYLYFRVTNKMKKILKK